MGRQGGRSGRRPDKLVADMHIRVPWQLWAVIKQMASSDGVPMWQFIQKAVTHYLANYRAHFKDVSGLDKASWYAFKLSSSVGEFKADPSDENLQRLLKTVEQVGTRLGINTDALVGAIHRYKERPTKKNRWALNDQAKLVVAQIMMKLLAGGEGGGDGGGEGES